MTVVDATESFGNARPGHARDASADGRPDRVTRLADKLRDTARVPDSDRSILAKNLGVLAARINPNHPLLGAERMFKTAALYESKFTWAKRKRLVRLPDEEAPAHERKDYGQYEGSGAKYDRLAKAAGEILARSSDPAIVIASQRYARRTLLLGTSLMPLSEPLPVSDRGALDLLYELSVRVGAAALRESSLGELWRLLDQTPITLEPVSHDLMVDCRQGPAGDAAIASAELKEILGWGPEVAFAMDKQDAASSHAAYWSIPALPIGRISRSMPSRLFILPTEIAAEVEPIPYGELPTRAFEWLTSKGFDGDRLPEVEWQEHTGYGWRAVDLNVQHVVSLTIERHTESGARLAIRVEGPIGGYPTFIWPDHVSDVEVADRAADNDVSVDMCAGGYFKALFRPAWAAKTGRKQAQFLGLFDHWGDYTLEPDCGDAVKGWIDDPLIASLLLDKSNPFHSSIDAPQLPVPCPGGSIAAALLRNIQGAADAARVDRLLIKRAQIIAGAALRYHEALVAHYRDAISKI